MTEAFENSTERTPRDIHDDYRNILRYFVAAAQLKSEAEVTRVKIENIGKPPEAIAMNIAKIRKRTRIEMLATAIYETKHFRSKIKQRLDRDPDSLEAKAYEGLIEARKRGDFDRKHDEDTENEITSILRVVPAYDKAQQTARLELGEGGQARLDRVQSYRAAAFILHILPQLPENPFAEAAPLNEVAQPRNELMIPRQAPAPAVV